MDWLLIAFLIVSVSGAVFGYIVGLWMGHRHGYTEGVVDGRWEVMHGAYRVGRNV